ncbi:MAG: hybrid sensor histidine kinase/response regulator [Hyphomicrobiales bacterium]|nr:hybrid sensor histidine kinase/response regulator [Hyphomicrobiales bacterium]
MDDLLNDFLSETAEQLEAVDAHLVHFEKNPEDPRAVADVFRLAHSIKGTCGFLGLDRLGRLAHAAEALITRMRDGAAPTPERVNLILAAIDTFREILSQLARTGVEPPGDDGELIGKLEAGLETQPHQTEWAAEPAPQEEPATETLSAAAPLNAGSPARDPSTIRVAVPALEQIMALVSELVLTRNQLMELTRDTVESELKAPILRLNALTSDLQDGVMRARMQPIGRLFGTMPRLLRGLSRQLGKKINLETEGASTELDRQLIELVREPLMHMIRNCADHGLESEAERIACGKTPTGTIRLSASHEAGHIKIIVFDDGRGLNVGRIADRVRRRGLATEQELARMGSEDICRFIFAPGFSTSTEITTISGRGIGLDVVRDSIEAIGGTVSIATVAGRGTTFTLKIPLTLAIAPALIVECSRQRLAIPQHAVIEVVGTSDQSGSSLVSIQGALLLRRGHQMLPVLDLAHELQLPLPGERIDPIVVVMRVGSQSFGVLVDTVFEVIEVVVKPLASALSHLTAFSGNTMLGDGSVVLIVDPAGLSVRLGMDRKNNFSVAAEQDTFVAVAERTQLVLFKTRPCGPVKGLPLSLITRIETIEAGRVEESGSIKVIRDGTVLMPIVFSEDAATGASEHHILVVSVGGEPMGIAAHEIVDIVEEHLDIQIAAESPGVIGNAMINGQMIELLDITFFMQLARPGAFLRGHARRFQVLLVDDKRFFRDMLAPILTAEGYRVTTAESAAEALVMFRKGAEFDVVLTDIDMPDMDGYTFTKSLLADPRRKHLPVLALDAHAAPAVQHAAEAAGMKGVVGKFDRRSLVAKLAELVSTTAFNSHAIEQRIIEEAAA